LLFDNVWLFPLPLSLNAATQFLALSDLEILKHKTLYLESAPTECT
jgi:hypothetical protein